MKNLIPYGRNMDIHNYLFNGRIMNAPEEQVVKSGTTVIKVVNQKGNQIKQEY